VLLPHDRTSVWLGFRPLAKIVPSLREPLRTMTSRAAEKWHGWRRWGLLIQLPISRVQRDTAKL